MSDIGAGTWASRAGQPAGYFVIRMLRCLRPACRGSAGRARVVSRRLTLNRDARAAVDANRHRPGDGGPLAAAVRAAVIEDRVMLRRPVVPDGQVALAPVPADRLLGPGHMLLQQPDQVTGRLRREP